MCVSVYVSVSVPVHACTCPVKNVNGLSSGTLEGCLAGPVVVADEYTFHYLPMVQ